MRETLSSCKRGQRRGDSDQRVAWEMSLGCHRSLCGVNRGGRSGAETTGEDDAELLKQETGGCKCASREREEIPKFPQEGKTYGIFSSLPEVLVHLIHQLVCSQRTGGSR